jgi:hypothetical protein
MNFTFLNHSGFLLEFDSAVLCFDPWLEGTAFCGAWELIDSSTSESTLLKHLQNLMREGKQVDIFISHEHPDHLRPQLIEDLMTIGCNVHWFPNLSYRLGRFLGKNSKETRQFIVHKDFAPIDIAKVRVQVVPAITGDSAFVVSNSKSVFVNLNDYVPETRRQQCRLERLVRAEKSVGKEVVVAAQFSWAGWVSNNDDDLKSWRKQKHADLFHFLNKINCNKLVPIASYAQWTQFENSRSNVALEHLLGLIDDCPRSIDVLVPTPFVSLDVSSTHSSVGHKKASNEQALRYWSERVESCSRLRPHVKSLIGLDETKVLESLNHTFDLLDERLTHDFPLVRKLAHRMRVIPDVVLSLAGTLIKVRIHCDSVVLETSDCAVDASVEPNYLLKHLFQTEFGFDTGLIGLFITPTSSQSLRRLSRAFTFQLLAQQHRTLRHPMRLLGYLIRKAAVLYELHLRKLRR